MFTLFHASLLAQTLNALSFGIFAVLTLRACGRGQAVWGGRFGGWVTLSYALFYVLELARRLTSTGKGATRWWFALNTADAVLLYALSPLMFHLLFRVYRRYLGRPRLWAGLVAASYLAGGAVLVTLVLFPALAGVRMEFPRSDPAFGALLILTGLAVIALLGSAFVRSSDRYEQIHLRRFAVVVAVLLLFQAVLLLYDWHWLRLARDITPAVLLFVLAYDVQRLTFFDVLVKQATFYFFGLLLLNLYFDRVPRILWSVNWGRYSLWVWAFSVWPIVPVTLWGYGRWTRWLDRVWLGRRLTAAEATPYFLAGLQGAISESELVALAEQRLASIFGSQARIWLGGERPAAAHGSMEVAIPAGSATLGHIQVQPRPHDFHFLSEDLALLSSLAQEFSIMLDNLRLREKKLEQDTREQELRLLASRAELRALRAQVNPHFLFNALSAIAGLITKEPVRAQTTVEQLAEVFRYTLHRSRNEWVRLEEELEFVTAYLDVERARFGARLRVESDIQGEAARLWMPAMLLQVLVENAVKHGLSAVRGPGLLVIRARCEEERLYIGVLDNGPGFRHTTADEDLPGSGYGLSNIRERLRGYFGDAAALRMAGEGGMTAVSVEMPAHAAPPEGGERSDDSGFAGRRRAAHAGLSQ